MSIKAFVKIIRQAFPEAATETDRGMIDQGFDPQDETHHLWIEAFADVTNTLIRNRDGDALRKHLEFFSLQYDKGSAEVRDCIDAGYVENLLWDLDVEDRKWVWPHFPDNLKTLHVAAHGQPAP